jgi:hypothetical protein
MGEQIRPRLRGRRGTFDGMRHLRHADSGSTARVSPHIMRRIGFGLHYALLHGAHQAINARQRRVR